MEVSQVESDPPVLAVAGTGAPPGSLQQEVEWMLFGGLSLKPFYERVAGHQVMEGAVRRLRGLKPSRPPSLFEMAVTAVTEQQISMAAAYQIRARLVEAFGDRILTVSQEGGPSYHAFPEPERLASASKDALRQRGLSGRKAEYILGLARAVVSGEIDLEGLRDLSDEEVRAAITGLRGFGPWSADYILVRGLGRLDCVPASDLGVRTVVGDLLGDGSRMDAEDVYETLAPFEPYKGLAAFYLLRYADVRGGSPS
jgi:DNA-3-methyladenine glycosylase II